MDAAGAGLVPQSATKRKGCTQREKKMPSQGSITKTIRFSAEDRAVVERIMENEGCTFNWAVHRAISDGGEPREDGDVSLSGGVYREINQMCRLNGLTFERFMEYIRALFASGSIYVEGLTVRTRGEYDLEGLKEVCHRVNVDPQEMINKLVSSLRR